MARLPSSPAVSSAKLPRIVPRVVFLPPERLGECVVCKAQTSLRLCASCEEVTYCSRECQKSHWSQHKLKCGKTDKIDLGGYYPFLAVLFEVGLTDLKRPYNITLTRRITNPFGPGTPPTVLPDGTEAIAICLGERVSSVRPSEEWWSNAPSNTTRVQLFLRLERAGWHLPIYLAIAISLLAEIYTTNARPTAAGLSAFEKKRTRLRIWGSPVSDFGIAKGKLRTCGHNSFAWADLGSENPTYNKIQDPDEHYMMYFQTLRGDEFILDCSGHAFGQTIIMPHQPYSEGVQDYPGWSLPVMFRPVTAAPYIDDPLTIQEHFSVLKNVRLKKAIQRSRVGFGLRDQKLMYSVMNEIAGRKCKEAERNLFMSVLRNSCSVLRDNLEKRAWADWPERAEPDSEVDVMAPTFRREVRNMEKNIRRVRRGEITMEEVNDALGKQLVPVSNKRRQGHYCSGGASCC